MSYFGKVITAMVTPFDDELNVDYDALVPLLEHLIENGSDAVVVSGTTGEGPTLTKEEKITLFVTVANYVNGRIKVIANVGSNNTRESIEFAKEVSELENIDGLMVVNPYYNKPSQEGLYQHFKAIAESTELPIMLYNIPGRTSVNLSSETTIKLSEIKNIVAIKESSGDLSQIARVIEGTSTDFSVYSGDDNLILPILALGGSGVVSVASHIIGNEIQQMISAYENGSNTLAAQIHRKFLSFFEGIFFKTNPVPIKALLRIKGIDVGSVRLPLIDLEKEEYVVAKVMLSEVEQEKKIFKIS